MLAFGQPPAYISLLRKEKERDLNPVTTGGCSFFSREGKGNIRDFLDTYLLHYEATRAHGFIGLPSGNHDSSRIAIGRTHREIELVFALIMTMPGIPFIYNGDEIGVRQGHNLISKEGGYNRTGARTPMQWNNQRNAGFSMAEPDQLYVPVDPDPECPTVANQEEDPDSLLNAVRRLTALRKANPALCGGSFVPLFAVKDQYPFVYERSDSDNSFLIAINPGAAPVTADFRLSKPVINFRTVAGHDVNCHVEGDQCRLSMPGISYTILTDSR